MHIVIVFNAYRYCVVSLKRQRRWVFRVEGKLFPFNNFCLCMCSDYLQHTLCSGLNILHHLRGRPR